MNTCQELGLPISITGNASAVDTAYGSVGVFDVVLEGTGSVCPGPNYIVQGKPPSYFSKKSPAWSVEFQETDLKCDSTEYVEGDYAIVQSPDWSTLFILSREQNVTTDKLDVSRRDFLRLADCRANISPPRRWLIAPLLWARLSH